LYPAGRSYQRRGSSLPRFSALLSSPPLFQARVQVASPVGIPWFFRTPFLTRQRSGSRGALNPPYTARLSCFFLFFPGRGASQEWSGSVYRIRFPGMTRGGKSPLQRRDPFFGLLFRLSLARLTYPLVWFFVDPGFFSPYISLDQRPSPPIFFPSEVSGGPFSCIESISPGPVAPAVPPPP